MNILVVDDEKGFTEVISDHLQTEHFEVDCASGGSEALDLMKGKRYHLVILDIMMPRVDGLQVLKAMRKNGDNTPVIFLTAKAEEEDKIKGLGLGADDYITKPFSMAELLARIRTVLRRAAPGSELTSLKIGKSVVDFEKFTVTRGSRIETMSRYEADLLRLLASDPGKIFSRDEILNCVWGVEAFPTNRTVDNYIVKLRQKLETNPKEPRYVVSVYGTGYKLCLE
ncbi:MAG: response regulator transcription factor [Kiritimatiellae bacterium]|nr:response regulator transcription factor [Kiritimatiellia bacterium]MDD5519949.1 response regulator transcription factor [Kiritimatiellia bacterium]